MSDSATPRTGIAVPERASGADQIAAERVRQIIDAGHTATSDDQHIAGELLDAARCFLFAVVFSRNDEWESPIEQIPSLPWWPFDRDRWDPRPNEQENLRIAGALIAAEIDRLDRAAKQQREGSSFRDGDVVTCPTCRSDVQLVENGDRSSDGSIDWSGCSAGECCGQVLISRTDGVIALRPDSHPELREAG